MYDITKLTDQELKILAKYILPNNLPVQGRYEQMLVHLTLLSKPQLIGTIGSLTGRFYNAVFLQSPYWKIITAHYKQYGVCPQCNEEKPLVIYSPAYEHMGVSHLHPEDVCLLCGSCHHAINQLFKEQRFWIRLSPKKDTQISEFLDLLKKHV